MAQRQGEAKVDGRSGGDCTETTGNVVQRRRVDHWAVHIFREHNKEAHAWAERGARGLTDEREDDSNGVWSDVTRNCAFGNGSCRKNVCGAGMWIKRFTPTLGWCTVHKRCGASAWWEFSWC